MKRGIILGPPIVFHNNKMVIRGTAIAPQILRKCLLFWDQIEFPITNLISFGFDDDAELLRQSGILRSPKVDLVGKFGSIDLAQAYNYIHISTYKSYCIKQNEKWSILQQGENLILPEDQTDIKETVIVEFLDVIPSPSPDVKIDQILIFKDKRADELQEFWSVLDLLYLEILGAPDKILKKDVELRKFQQQIGQIERLMAESKIKRLLGGFKVEFNISDYIRDAFLTSTLSSVVLGLGPTASVALGLGTSLVKVSFSKIPTLKGLPETLNDYAYIAQVQQEFNGSPS